MLVYINGEVIQRDGVAIHFSKVVKNENDLLLYVNNGLHSKYSGIKNWKDIDVRGGEISEEIDNSKVALDNLMNMKLDNAQYLVEKKAILQELMDMKLKLMKGGL